MVTRDHQGGDRKWGCRSLRFCSAAGHLENAGAERGAEADVDAEAAAAGFIGLPCQQGRFDLTVTPQSVTTAQMCANLHHSNLGGRAALLHGIQVRATWQQCEIHNPKVASAHAGADGGVAGVVLKHGCVGVKCECPPVRHGILCHI